ncbi:glycosyltransferase [Thermodesulfovibrionales bacterium]|nr:glycosyltransferase [Thermodesulfovibrionales bacterium]
MTKLRLSICIATYNRAEYIGETLESIIPQITDEVEIVIVDGASTDDTSTVVKSYMEACKQIRYIRLPSKGGIDQDYCTAVEHARGEMCWLFPDDDLLKPNAINTVLDETKKGYSLIVVNAQVMNKDFSKILEDRRVQIDTNEIYLESELELLFHRAISYMSFIGCVVINRDLWLQREKKRYFGTEFIHIGVIFQAPLPAPAIVIAEPYITIRYGNAQWTPRAFEIWMFKWPNLLCSFAHISEQVRQECQQTRPWQRLKGIIIYRAKGAYSLKEYKKWFGSKDLSLWWRMGALFIAIMPCFFVNVVVLSYFKTIKKEALMSIYDLENSKYK